MPHEDLRVAIFKPLSGFLVTILGCLAAFRGRAWGFAWQAWAAAGFGKGIRKASGFYFFKLLGFIFKASGFYFLGFWVLFEKPSQAKPSQAKPFFLIRSAFLFETLLKVFEKLLGSIFSSFWVLFF